MTNSMDDLSIAEASSSNEEGTFKYLHGSLMKQRRKEQLAEFSNTTETYLAYIFEL